MLKLLSLFSRLQPLDYISLTLMLVLSLLIGLLVWSGNDVIPYVRDFSWHSKIVITSDNFFTLTFSRPVNHSSVEANLHISPSLPGEISWAGLRLIYTLTVPAVYDTTYKVELNKVLKQWQPFVDEFQTPNRAFIYIGIEGEEKGRLILYNLSHRQKTILTPKNLVVTNFKPYPSGNQILFAASDWLHYGPGLFEQELYTVTTGRSQDASPAGKINKILDNINYQNQDFDISANGEVIVVRRVQRSNLSDSDLWFIKANAKPQPLKNEIASSFLLTPDSNSVALSLPDGIAIVPLTPSTKPLDFLPQFDRVLSFSRDGVQAAMAKFNSDNTQSLFFINNQGFEKELIAKIGEHLYCQFNSRTPTLYCLLTPVFPGKIYDEQLILAAIDLKTFQIKPMLELGHQVATHINLSPDGLALLLDQMVTTNKLDSKDELTTDIGSAIVTSHLTLLQLDRTNKSITTLPVKGFQPYWLP